LTAGPGERNIETTMLTTKTSRFTILGLALLFAICLVSRGLAKEQVFTTIDVPGAIATFAYGISPQGDIVGYYIGGAGLHGFLLSQGASTTIDVPGASYTEALGIDPQGDIVGVYYKGGDLQHGFLLSQGRSPPSRSPALLPPAGSLDWPLGSMPKARSWGPTVPPQARMAFC
jgi:hypothetical protein